jgi:hypothetical protein
MIQIDDVPVEVAANREYINLMQRYWKKDPTERPDAKFLCVLSTIMQRE